MLRRVLLYKDQIEYQTIIGGLRRTLPLVKVDNDLWIASNAGIILGDIEFISNAARLMVEKIAAFEPEIVVTPEAKAIAFAYQVAKDLGHARMIVVRKSIKSYMENYIMERVKSITTNEFQTLVLTLEDASMLKGKRICIIDDVVSTGGTIRALENLVKKAECSIVCKASIWIEGPWYSDELVYLGELPIFVSEKKFKELQQTMTTQ
ncbi:MAG: phosphoribosyltransferase family protein [Candidatus Methanomethyliaceae archaeon]|nr:phosphoribosyltransferase family protein [Candidatus Methanomethyliaceae archaeon]